MCCYRKASKMSCEKSKMKGKQVSRRPPCALCTCRIHVLAYAQKASRRESKRLSTVGISGFRARKARLVFLCLQHLLYYPNVFLLFFILCTVNIFTFRAKNIFNLVGKRRERKERHELEPRSLWRALWGRCRHTHGLALLSVSMGFSTHFLRVKLQWGRLGGFGHMQS